MRNDREYERFALNGNLNFNVMDNVRMRVGGVMSVLTVKVSLHRNVIFAPENNTANERTDVQFSPLGLTTCQTLRFTSCRSITQIAQVRTTILALAVDPGVSWDGEISTMMFSNHSWLQEYFVLSLSRLALTITVLLILQMIRLSWRIVLRSLPLGRRKIPELRNSGRLVAPPGGNRSCWLLPVPQYAASLQRDGNNSDWFTPD